MVTNIFERPPTLSPSHLWFVVDNLFEQDFNESDFNDLKFGM